MARSAPAVPGVFFTAQGVPPATTQSELYAGWAGAALVVVVFAWLTYRRFAPQRLARKEATRDAAAHWALQRSTADRCVLTNTSPQTAHEVTLAIRPRGQHAPLALWVNMFGSHALSDRLRQRHPNRHAQPLHPRAAVLVASGANIELQLRSNAEDGWLEVEWRQADGTSNWTKYVIPDNIDQASSTA
jgi:hypothetical protein